MTLHPCTWTPIPGERARYRCAHGTLGYRAGDGVIRVYRGVPPPVRQALTARPVLEFDGRVEPWIPEEHEQGRERDA